MAFSTLTTDQARRNLVAAAFAVTEVGARGLFAQMRPDVERRRAEGPRLALAMADVHARFGDFDRALRWSAVAEAELGRLPSHYRDRRSEWAVATSKR